MTVAAPAGLADLTIAATLQQLRARHRGDERPDAVRARRRYRDDPAAFAVDAFTWTDGASPAPYQLEILDALARSGRVAVRKPHGAGGTALAAWALWWFALTRETEDWKAPTTAGAWRQLTHYLWPEIRKWGARLRPDVIGRPRPDGRELLSLSLRLGRGEAFAAASSDAAKLEGAHADALFYVFDESKSIAPATFDAAEGAFAGTGETFALAISTPGEPAGRFYEIHRRAPGYGDWWTRHVQLSECVDAGRVSASWAADRAAQWGAGSAVYQNRVLGEFASTAGEGVIPLAWVEAANQRWAEWAESASRDGGHLAPLPLTAVGVDVGWTGADPSVFALRAVVGGVDVITELRRYAGESPMQIAGHVRALVRQFGGRAVIDSIGLGAGVYDRLREADDEGVTVDVVGFNAAERAETRDRSGQFGFLNKRAAAWWGLRERLDPERGDGIALPPDDGLTGDLTAPHWSVTSGGRIAIESKEQIRARLGRSTDAGDAVVMAFYDGGGRVHAY